MATLIWTDGAQYEVPDDKIEQALADGFRQPNADDGSRAAAGDQNLRAGLEGGFRGATAGFGERALVELEQLTEGPRESPWEPKWLPEEEARKRVLLRKEENPVISTAGEITGMVAPALFTGGASAAPGVAARATLGRVVGRAALEGGVYGAGQVYSEATLENKPLHAENLAAGFAGGALTGGTFGVVGHGLQKGVSAGLKVIGGEALSETLKGAGREAKWFNLAGSNRKLLAKEGLKDDIIDLADNLKIKDFSLDAVDAVESHRANVLSPRYDAILSKLDEVSPVKGMDILHLENVINQKLTDKFGRDALARPALKAAREELQFMVDNAKSWRDVHTLQKGAAEAGRAGDTVRKLVGEELLEGIKDAAGKTSKAGPVGNKVGTVAGGARAAAQDGGTKVSSIPLGVQLDDLNREYAAAVALREAVKKRALDFESKGGPLMAGVRGGGAALLGGLMGGPGGVMAGAAYQVGKEYAARKGGFILGNVLEHVGPAAARMAKGLEQRISTVAASGLLGKFTLPLTNAAALGTNELLAEHARIASGPEGGQYMALLGLSPESPEELKSLGQRMGVLESIDASSKAFQDELDGAAAGFFDSKGSVPAARKAPRGDFEARLKSLEKIVTDPQAIFDAMPGEFMGAAPEVTGMTAAKLAEAAKFLYKKAPRSPWADKPEALQQPWKPSAADVERWYRYVEGVEDPRGVLGRMKDGTATKEHLEAVQQIYPQMYQKLQEAMSEKLMEWKKPLPWDKRQVLAQLLGQNVYASPQQVSTLQQVHAKNRKKDGQQKGPDGRQQVNAEKNMATQSQRLEAR